MEIKKIIPIAFLFFTAIIFNTCHEETVWMNEAEITGFDPTLCACCGGLFIEIENEIYRFDGVPADSDLVITSETIFPVSVQVNWHIREGACSDLRIIVDQLVEE